jgi:predicted RNase H-like nuclease
MRVIGLDACPRGWVAVVLTDGTRAEVRAGTALAQLLADCGLADGGGADGICLAGIDMPLGLVRDGWRTADRAAAALLGPRRSSVFAIPPRAVWEQDSYPAANAVCRRLTGRGFSVQAWGLRRKLLEANEYRQTGRHRLYEVHPELAFGAMADAPLTQSKHTPDGRARRGELIKDAGMTLPARSPAPLADTLDAAAVAWSAHRIATGVAVTVPGPPQPCDRGMEIAIRY